MRIVVDSYPKSVRDCLFSERVAGGDYYVCALRSYVEEADRNNTGYKPKCICKRVDICERLVCKSDMEDIK